METLPKLRDDLEITKKIVDGAVGCVVRKPSTGETFELGEIEYFMLSRLDGESTPDSLIQALAETHEIELGREDLNAFIEGLRENGLIGDATEEPAPAEEELVTPQVDLADLDDWETDLLQMEDIEGVENWAQAPTTPMRRGLGAAPLAADVADAAAKFEAVRARRAGVLKRPKRYWRLLDTNGIFAALARWLGPFSALVYLLPFLLVLAVFTVMQNWTTVRLEMGMSWGLWTLFQHLLFSLVTVNFLSKLLSGVIARRMGADAPGMGIALAMGVLPRFHVEIESFENLPKRQQLWVFAGPLLVRLFLFSLAAVGWMVTRSGGTQLPVFLFVLATVAMFSFLLTVNPLGKGDGYAFLSTYFDVPQFRSQAFRVLLAPILPESMRLDVSDTKAAALRAYALAAIAWMLFLVGIILYFSAVWLELHFGGTGVVLFLILAALVLAQIIGQIRHVNRVISRQRKASEAHSEAHEADVIMEAAPASRNGGPPPRRRTGSGVRSKKKKKAASSKGWLFWLVLAAAFAALWVIPYPYETGGVLELRPVQKREIYAEISGIVEYVSTPGGKLVEKGQVLGQIAAYRQEEEVAATKAQIEKNQAELDLLLTSPRKEEVVLAERQFDAAKVEERFWKEQLTRQERLLKEGHTTQEEFDATRQKAEVAAQEVLEKEAKLALVKEGPHPEEINAARAELRELQAQLLSNEERLARTSMRTTINGRVTDLELENLEGKYLEAGDLFAEVIDDSSLKAYISVPEADLGKIAIGSRARLKFWAFPDRIYKGTVDDIEPTVSEETFGRVVPVVVKLPNEHGELKAGMTGYGKIAAGIEPVIVAFTHRIVRFFTVEVWSWIP